MLKRGRRKRGGGEKRVKEAKPVLKGEVALKERVEARAVSRYAKISAKKANRILRLIRNRNVPDALNTLIFLNKPSKTPVLKTLKSAIANAILKAGKAKLKEEELIVKEARADEGSRLKRFQPAPHGRAMMIRRRTSHITVCVAQREA